jgi:creatinine amidohydrolase
MPRLLSTIPAIALLSAASAFGQPPAVKPAPASTATARAPLVEFEMMTWPEVKAALAAGKTTALVYTGDLPGTIGLSNEVFGQMLTEIAEQSITTGFKNVVLMGDHGGGQPQVFAEVAKKLDAKYSPKGIHVYFCDEVYAKAQGDFDDWLVAHGYPRSSHAGIPDTSTMLYLGGDKGWVRKDLIPTAEGDPVPPPGQRGQGRGQTPDPNAPPRKNNGISGDARRSTPALGKMAFDIKVDYATKQIQGFLANQQKTTAQQ